MSDLFTPCNAGFPEPCCTFIRNEWLYQGTHDMTATDKWQDNKAYQQMMANGFVYDPAGNRYGYREKQKWEPTKGWTHDEILVH